MIAAEALRTGLLLVLPTGPALAAFLGLDFFEPSCLIGGFANAVNGRVALRLLGPLACPKDRKDRDALAGLWPFKGLAVGAFGGILSGLTGTAGRSPAVPILSFCAIKQLVGY